MFEWTPRDRGPSEFESGSAPPRYKAEVRRRGSSSAATFHLYDGGDCSPYCLDSLIDLLRSETRTTRDALDLSFEILDQCSGSRVQEVAARFARAAVPGLRVTLRARGREPVHVDSAVGRGPNGGDTGS
jgi:hypothetical protein